MSEWSCREAAGGIPESAREPVSGISQLGVLARPADPSNPPKEAQEEGAGRKKRGRASSITEPASRKSLKAQQEEAGAQPTIVRPTVTAAAQKQNKGSRPSRPNNAELARRALLKAQEASGGATTPSASAISKKPSNAELARRALLKAQEASATTPSSGSALSKKRERPSKEEQARRNAAEEAAAEEAANLLASFTHQTTVVDVGKKEPTRVEVQFHQGFQ